MNQEYFVFELASSIYLGVPLVNMGTVIQLEVQNICTVPGVASFWYGVVNYKGSLLWVLDSDRFFNLPTQRQQRIQKLTAVILKPDASDSQKQVALVTTKLNGIAEIEPSCLEPLSDNVSPQLHQCCSASVQTESQTTYMIDAASLLEQVYQQSSLVSA
ncbi:MAG: chemotaxis protein CheW [Cyanobacteria bacterium P01_G01_bin.67]